MNRERAREEIVRIREHLEQALGIPSRWSGRLLIATSSRQDAYAWVNDHYDIVLHRDFLRSPTPVVLATLYHEVAHTFSPAARLENPLDAAIEEIAAEVVARTYRRRRLRSVARGHGMERLRRMDRTDAYSPLVAEFRRGCRHRGIDAEEFARHLLLMSEKERRETLMRVRFPIAKLQALSQKIMLEEES